MNTIKRALHILLPVLVLAVASLGCGFLTPPTPTPEPTDTPEPTNTPVPTETPVPTPTSTPTPTLIPLPEMSVYTNQQLGISMDYPTDWYVEEDEDLATSSVVFSTEEGFEIDQADGAGFGMVAINLAGATSDVEELWDLFTSEASDEGTILGDPVSSLVGGQDAIGGSYENEEDDFYGWLTMAIANDYGYIFLAVVSPADDWEDYEPTFTALLDSVEFSEPEAGSGGDGGGGEAGGTFTSRDDIPIPDDADVQLDMSTLFSYLTEASIIDAARFCEENWPDYGWTANTDDILYSVGEETSLLFFSKGAESALVAVTIDDDTGKTTVSIIISEE